MATRQPSSEQDRRKASLEKVTLKKYKERVYVAGISERIRKACRNYNIRVVFRSGPTLRYMLTKVKDPSPVEKQVNVAYKVPCTCGKVYNIRETKRRL